MCSKLQVQKVTGCLIPALQQTKYSLKESRDISHSCAQTIPLGAPWFSVHPSDGHLRKEKRSGRIKQGIVSDPCLDRKKTIKKKRIEEEEEEISLAGKGQRMWRVLVAQNERGSTNRLPKEQQLKKTQREWLHLPHNLFLMHGNNVCPRRYFR